MLTRLLILVGLPILFVNACQSPDTQASESEASTTFFKPVPKAVPKQEVEPLALGSPAPDFKLPGVDERFYSLADFADQQVLAIVFTCNHCPTAQAYEDRLIQLASDYENQSVALVAISPNSPLGLLYEELGYSDLDDSYAAMQIRAEEKQLPFPYLYDGDQHEASLLYGPVATPHVFVFGKDRKLAYAGRIDGSEKPGTAHAEDLRAAIDDLLAGRAVAKAQTKAFGCSTKWAWKTEWKEKVESDWANAEVSLEKIDPAGLKALMENDSDKLRLVNVWATWCGPCKLEYPDLVAIHRMFKGRDFEFISISADRIEQKDAALKFLEEQHSALKNYLAVVSDNGDLIEAIDPNWQGALPYTALVEPDGNIVFAHQGAVNMHNLRKVIVEHPMIGRYY